MAANNSEAEAVQALRQKGDEITNESLAATRRIRQMAEESEQVGGATLNKLEAQGEQLNNVERDMDKINAGMKKAEGEMQEMEKCCGLCVCPWQRQGNYENSSAYNKAYGSGALSQPKAAKKPGEAATTKPAGGAGDEPARMKRVTNDAREDEMEENLDAVGGILANLKGQAQAMNEELASQNQQLDRVNIKADSNIGRINAGNKRAEEILRSG
eukprot:comp12704_c0_seq1/m.7802 comp12704_c0_seq1/g.7802  ORF comp12704_c0_seq1/g.7802 comp12704_c0_seq1/m.7802 type:complete len:214 (-) comp12704_c0_seq1:218-859(-)